MYLTNIYKTFVQSFRTMRLERSIQVILYDLGFYFLLSAVFIFFMRTLEAFNYSLGMMANSATSRADLLDPLKVDILQSTLSTFFYKAIAAIVLFLVVGSLITGLFKGFIWDTMRGKKISMRNAWNYSLLTFYWILINCVIFFLIFLVSNPVAGAYLIILQAFLFIHILLNIFIVRSTGKGIRVSMKDGLKNSFHYRLILPYIIILMIYLILFIGVLRWPLDYVPYLARVIISWMLTVIYMAWARNYIMLITK